MLYDIALYSSVAGIISLFGVWLVLKNERIAKKYSVLLISIAVGVLLGASFLQLIPEALALTSDALFYILIGFLAFYLIENIFVVHSCKEEDCRVHRMTTMSVLGLGIHSLIDGVAIGIGFGVSFSLGIVTAIAVIAHEFPEGLITMSLLLNSKFRRKTSIFYGVLVAVATPIGAILSFFFIPNMTAQVMGILLALIAGTFIYIAASDLIPETHEKFSKFNALLVIVGILFIYAVTSTFR